MYRVRVLAPARQGVVFDSELVENLATRISAGSGRPAREFAADVPAHLTWSGVLYNGMTLAVWHKVNKIMVASGDLDTTPSADEGNMWTDMYLAGQ